MAGRDQQPVEPTGNSHDKDVVPVWVMASRWETVVVTTAPEGGYQAKPIERTRPELAQAVAAVMHAARAQADVASSERRRAVEALCDLTGEIVAAFPEANRLLILPLGVCALLPYAAAPHRESFLIDRVTVTVAPTLAWAREVRRPRRPGPSIGVFHPGNPPNAPLKLEGDRAAFAGFVSHEVLDEPTAGEVLAYLQPDTDIAHFSCHGSYNALTPLESWLDLGSELTLQAVLDHPSAPWLVNLSACETGVPDLQASEQAISFPTGFLRAGAAHVIATPSGRLAIGTRPPSTV